MMKNPMDVLRSKEQQLLQVRREIEALRVALPLLGEESDVTPTAMALPVKSAQRVVQLP
jgi:hypothetical protein